MKRKLHTILVTGGAGFIGSNFIHYLFGKSTSGEAAFEDARFSGRIVHLDALTYAGNGESLDDIDAEFGTGARDGQRYFFEKADICDRAAVERIFRQYDIDTVVHFAAESHVDRSIVGPEAFVRTNVLGTYTLLDVARTYWGISLDNPRDDVLFHHISTDEVYGSLGPTGYFTETTPYDPRSPYSASKASSDHIVMAYHHTYGLPVTLSNCTNNYGPFQFPEKLLPLMIRNM
ncbi:MAG: GDP-mannose 4,6-dehydratase, partial [Treponemataceae bacterium]|nr:GDP-mannose 4,6-dehydratase [Treponemataceae bacterium]